MHSGGSMRDFVDSAGIDWTVFEVRRQGNEEDNWAYLPRGFRSGWLCFESDVGKRRLSPVPDGWKTTDASDLERMLRRATPVGKAPITGFSEGLSFRPDAGAEGAPG
jgi:hypothetical protein